MSIDLEDEILQDFLVEAGEILELLGEQLVELEQTPEDFELLNAIFRGFHTIKGGAGFLSLEALVSVCHKAEDVFDVLREGERKVCAELMDVILEVVDVVNIMFEQVKQGIEPESADSGLLHRLQGFTREGNQAEQAVKASAEVETAVVKEVVSEAEEQSVDIVAQEFEGILEETFELDGSQSATPADAADDEISEDEFDSLLDELHGKGQFSAAELVNKPEEQPKQTAAAADSEHITEEEFDSLLDELHGEGKFSAKSLAEPSVPAVDSGDITEDEFDSLLDELHGKGQFKGSIANQNTETSETKAPVESTADVVAEQLIAEPEQKPNLSLNRNR